MNITHNKTTKKGQINDNSFLHFLHFSHSTNGSNHKTDVKMRDSASANILGCKLFKHSRFWEVGLGNGLFSKKGDEGVGEPLGADCTPACFSWPRRPMLGWNARVSWDGLRILQQIGTKLDSIFWRNRKWTNKRMAKRKRWNQYAASCNEL